ncbi:MAG: hypothetical protein LC624_05210 [Halobacteriales archaeon]|nr:hypothetical protein [Halobacteriales archaeon]
MLAALGMALGAGSADPGCVATDGAQHCHLLAATGSGDAVADPWCGVPACVGGTAVTGRGYAQGSVAAFTADGDTQSDNHAVTLHGNATGGNNFHGHGFAISAQGSSRGGWSITGIGDSQGELAISGEGTSRGTWAVSGAGASHGTGVAVTALGTSEGPLAVTAAGASTSCPDHVVCVAVVGMGASDAGTLAVSGVGDATCRAGTCAALAPVGDSEGAVAVSGMGHARGGLAGAGACDLPLPECPRPV